MNQNSTSARQRISIIVPVHNGENYLGDAIASILSQDYQPIEVIVVDDGSTDKSRSVAQQHPQVRYVYQPQQGSAVARNTGLEISSGELIAFLDADDIWLPGKLSLQAAHLADHPEVGCVFGGMTNFLEPEMECPSWIDPGTLSQPFSMLHLCSMLARRPMFEVVGNFNATYRQGQDLEWFMRVKESGIRFALMSEPVFRRRIHASNISHNQSTLAQGRLRMLKESIDRKRSAEMPFHSGAF
jgi:glycosyltransferase involved in cell wall biosynthesis